jgi:hypothetical protein
MAKRKLTLCRECGAETAGGVFCTGPACRSAWHNRRKARGAEVYDLLMAMRFERDKAKADKLFTVICGLASVYRDGDNAEREGRMSWDSDAALARIPRFGRTGDGR